MRSTGEWRVASGEWRLLYGHAPKPADHGIILIPSLTNANEKRISRDGTETIRSNPRMQQQSPLPRNNPIHSGITMELD